MKRTTAVSAILALVATLLVGLLAGTTTAPAGAAQRHHVSLARIRVAMIHVAHHNAQKGDVAILKSHPKYGRLVTDPHAGYKKGKHKIPKSKLAKIHADGNKIFEAKSQRCPKGSVSDGVGHMWEDKSMLRSIIYRYWAAMGYCHKSGGVMSRVTKVLWVSDDITDTSMVTNIDDYVDGFPRKGVENRGTNFAYAWGEIKRKIELCTPALHLACYDYNYPHASFRVDSFLSWFHYDGGSQ